MGASLQGYWKTTAKRLAGLSAALLLFCSAAVYAQTISIVSGNGQLICSACPNKPFAFDPLVVAVKDASGRPVPNATVAWTVTNPPGSEGRVISATTTTGADGTSSNTFFLPAPLSLLATYVQATVTATAFGSSVTFTETNSSVTTSTGIALIATSILSPTPGVTLTGSPGSVSSVPVHIAVASFSPGGPVSGVEVRVVSDPALPASATCVPASGSVSGAVLTDTTGNAVCNLKFGSATGNGQIRIYVGAKYAVYGPFNIQVNASPGPPPTGPGAAQLVATPASLVFHYPGTLSQTVAVSSSTGTVAYTAAVQMGIARIDWITVSTPTGPASNNGPSTFQVTIAPQSLQPGTYWATIVIHPNNGAPDTSVTAQVIVETATATPSVIAVAPSTLNVKQTAGGAPLAAGVVNITSSVPASQFSASISGAAWLSIGPTAGTTPGQLIVSVSGAGLQPGNYTGAITISVPGASNSPISIPVNLAVEPAQNLRLSTTSLAFVSRGEPQPPPSQTVTAAASNGSLSFIAVTAVTSPQPGNWLSVTPPGGTTGDAGMNLVVSVNPSGLAPGVYTGTITLVAPSAANSPQAIAVTYAVGSPPAPAPGAVVNAGSNAPGAVSPGEIISIYGSNLGPSPGVSSSTEGGYIQTAVVDTRVTFDDIPAPLLFVSDTQINAIVPYGVAGRAVTRVAVTYKNATSAVLTLNVADAAPGIFVNPGGQGAILNENGSINSPANAAAKGSVIVIYATGEGATDPVGTDGKIIPADITQLKKPVLPVTVTIGGYTASVQYAGSAPGLVSGAFQVNAVVPNEAPSGDAVPVTITVGTARSQGNATVAIR